MKTLIITFNKATTTMNQTYKELVEIAKAENVLYSGTNKGTLINCFNIIVIW